MTKHHIERLGHLGDGIAPGPVYVDRALSGEVVAGVVEDGRIARAKILTPSPDRVRAPCPHYNACGGCALMHASDGFVERWKAGVVETALAAQGIEATVSDVTTSPPQSRRRAALSGRRLKSGPVVGFHGRGSDVITKIDACRVLAPALLEALPAAEAISGLLATRKGSVRMEIRASDAGIDTYIDDTRPLDRPLWQSLADLAQRFDLARLSMGDEIIVTRNPPVQTFDGIPVIPPPGAFLQATEHGEKALRAGIDEAICGASRIADLFAGCGTFSLPLARKAPVDAFESAPALVDALDAAWRGATGLKRIEPTRRDLFRRPLLPDELDRYDAVVVDPPRAGAEAQTRALAGSRVPRIAFASCNPVTFARDARILIEGGYRLHRVQVIDQFRWSPHVELVAAFSRSHMADEN